MRASPLAVSSRLPPQPNPQIIDSRVDFITTLRSRQADLRPTRSFPLVNPPHMRDGPLLAVSVDDLIARLSRSRIHSPREGFQSNTPFQISDMENRISSIARLGDEPSRQLPLSAGAVYLRPLKRHAQYGLPACDLQLRSYNVRNVEFFADFALRAAYYLYLPAVGPIPLPRITERWTVPRSNFVHKKSQENFERITIRRLIQVQDGHPETVEIWLAFLRKHAYYGIGMKANVWEHAKLGRPTELLLTNYVSNCPCRRREDNGCKH